MRVGHLELAEALAGQLTTLRQRDMGGQIGRQAWCMLKKSGSIRVCL